MEGERKVLSVMEQLQDDQPMVQGKKFGIRALSWIIDQLFMYAIDYATGFLAGMFIGYALMLMDIEVNYFQELPWGLSLLLGLFGALVYAVSFEAFFGATIGKLLLGMRVIKTDGTPCDFKAALVRGVLRFVDAIVFGLIAYMSMKPPLYQRLGDQSAKTLVVSSRDPIIREARSWDWIILAGLFYLVINGIVTVLILLMMIR
ncbi:MAG TPA: RDD family protein [Anaerolineae bacterium]|nr:RDD family protein [Anaerolineae bacterium]